MAADVAEAGQRVSDGGSGTDLGAELGIPLDLLQPVLQGARARGMSDALELVGMPAIFFDASGNLLHAPGSARTILAPWFTIAGEQLVGTGASSNRILEALVQQGIAGTAAGAILEPPGDAPDQAVSTVELRILPMPAMNGWQIARVLLLVVPLTTAQGEKRVSGARDSRVGERVGG